MAVKHFILNPKIESLSADKIQEIETDKQNKLSKNQTEQERLADKILHEEDNLKCVPNRVIIKINKEGKNYHSFENGQIIRRERQFNELNRRVTEPVNAIVIDAENIPKNADILIHFNSVHDSNRIFNYKDKSVDIRYYSIKAEDCFFWKDTNGSWQPLEPYETALRVFELYKGVITSIPPKMLSDVLYCTSGELNGHVVKTLKACDMEIVFQGDDLKEKSLIRFRPFGDEKTKREPEAITILNHLTEKVNNGELLIGLTESDCKPLTEINAYAD